MQTCVCAYTYTYTPPEWLPSIRANTGLLPICRVETGLDKRLAVTGKAADPHASRPEARHTHPAPFTLGPSMGSGPRCLSTQLPWGHQDKHYWPNHGKLRACLGASEAQPGWRAPSEGTTGDRCRKTHGLSPRPRSGMGCDSGSPTQLCLLIRLPSPDRCLFCSVWVLGNHLSSISMSRPSSRALYCEWSPSLPLGSMTPLPPVSPSPH